MAVPALVVVEEVVEADDVDGGDVRDDVDVEEPRARSGPDEQAATPHSVNAAAIRSP